MWSRVYSTLELKILDLVLQLAAIGAELAGPAEARRLADFRISDFAGIYLLSDQFLQCKSPAATLVQVWPVAKQRKMTRWLDSTHLVSKNFQAHTWQELGWLLNSIQVFVI